MNYNQILDFLYSRLPMFQRIGAAAYKADLEKTLALSQMLGKPERKFRSIHIAGTNGKGSTSHFIASILQEAGYNTGLFTSPHLRDFRERIRINGQKITKSEVCRFVIDHRKAFLAIEPSFFEWSFALATQHFANHQVDVAVIETGLGGRLDSTNIIQPDLSIITNIGMDHTQFLGNTLEAIAGEKAGIIKKGIPVVIGETQPGISAIFEEKASAEQAPVYFADQRFKVEASGLSKHKSPLLWISISSNGIPLQRKIYSSLVGNYQQKNLVTVLQAVELLRNCGYRISDEHLCKGTRNVVRNTGLLGRWQILSRSPLVVADIGHNTDGIKAVLNQLQSMSFKNLHFVIGFANDKDIKGILDLLPGNATYYYCKANIPRGMEAAELLKTASTYGLKGKAFPSVSEAFHAAKKYANPDDLILIGGSAFIVAEVV